jgi:hypothetical protein
MGRAYRFPMRRKPATTSSQVLSTRKQKAVRNDPKNCARSTAKSKRPTSSNLTAQDKALREAHERFFAEAGAAEFTWID